MSALDWLSHGFIQLSLESPPQFIICHFPSTCPALYYPPRDIFFILLCNLHLPSHSLWLLPFVIVPGFTTKSLALLSLPFQVAVGSYWAALQPPVCQTQQAWIPQAIFWRHVLHAADHLGSISQSSFKPAKCQQDLGVHMHGEILVLVYKCLPGREIKGGLINRLY